MNTESICAQLRSIATKQDIVDFLESFHQAKVPARYFTDEEDAAICIVSHVYCCDYETNEYRTGDISADDISDDQLNYVLLLIADLAPVQSIAA
ncbi:hypothetical protein F0L74_09880 [Chitinophaga agrisoli]|uniref:Uncharacterized protein n=1 Tax=Chitinophaga agrisoli TaxID=2607653 RepID=A0A5B2VW53_9BACT|nr:hypothetical protein [Chitinophaga agrisoli]KAA2242828.1 hypothetical protein F0L74_09880 [Chitinophaga agrisoli]